MVRVVSYKTLLLLLILVVVSLTLVFISRCTTTTVPANANAAGGRTRPLSRKSGSSFAYDTNTKVDESGGGFSYYQSVNADYQPPNYDGDEGSTKRRNDGEVKSGSKSKAKAIAAETINAAESKNAAEPKHDSNGGGLEYPFEEELEKPLGKKKTESLEGYDVEEGVKGTRSKNFNNAGKRKDHGKGGSIVDITCDINHGRLKVGCKRDQTEVYVPFSFLKNYFEVFGKLEEPQKGVGEDQQAQVFTWLHSQANIYKPKSPYNPKGVFTYFANYNVEVRDRVKCISGAEGVPVSTQWDIKGYFYPIQIAQFGLSHFSKYLTEGEPKRVVLDDGDDIRGKWVPEGAVNTFSSDVGDPSANSFMQIKPNKGRTLVKLQISETQPRILTLSWQLQIISKELKPNFTMTAVVRYESQVFNLHYVTDDFLIKVKENNIFHGIGYKSTSSWHHIIRDLGVDVQKGVALLVQSNRKLRGQTQKISKAKLQLESITIEMTTEPENTAVILLDNLTLSANEHLAQFFQAADWFVFHQDSRGGWPIPVRRKFASDFYPVLEPGWYSAMGQGHALSLLSRAYSVTTNNSHYAEACLKALESVFDKTGTEHGVRALFLDQFVWYEEYPTSPSSFVLNGFMYALLGLYDVKAVNVLGAADKAAELYESGLRSLKSMLPLFDTGSGTMYDLRHFTVPGISPNLARLDYHVTHINQLLTFATFEKDPIFETTAKRWIGYTQGDRAPHN